MNQFFPTPKFWNNQTGRLVFIPFPFSEILQNTRLREVDFFNILVAQHQNDMTVVLIKSGHPFQAHRYRTNSQLVKGLKAGWIMQTPKIVNFLDIIYHPNLIKKPTLLSPANAASPYYWIMNEWEACYFKNTPLSQTLRLKASSFSIYRILC